MCQESKIRRKLALSRCNMYGGMWVVAKPITQLSSMLATSLAAGKLETSIGSASPHHLKHPAAANHIPTMSYQDPFKEEKHENLDMVEAHLV